MNEEDALELQQPACYRILTEHQPCESGPGPHAILVVHGMGQQSTFDTLTEVSDGILAELEQQRWRVTSRRVRRVRIGDECLSRVEIDAKTVEGESFREIHIYEAYWAPLTEGRVALRDVMRFLWASGLGGLKRSASHFRRWAFGTTQMFNPVVRTPLYLLATMILLASLMAIDAGVGAVTLDAAWRDGTRSFLLQDLNTTTSILAAVALTFGAVLSATCAWKRATRERFPASLAVLGWLHAFFLGIVLIATAAHCSFLVWNRGSGSGRLWWDTAIGPIALAYLSMATLTTSTLALVVLFFARVTSSAETALWNRRLAMLLGAFAVIAPPVIVLAGVLNLVGTVEPYRLRIPWAWMALVGVTLSVRQLLVQYVGDVAAYVSPQTLDKFNDLREEIKRCVYKTGSAIYRATENGRTPLYSGVTVVAHSLGSVAAYDLLNKLLLEDGLDGRCADVRRRTAGLVTFGSPLDKTAFLFALQHGPVTAYALAATVQPMIQDYAWRPDVWINIYSRHDIISGSLDYYDHPGVRTTKAVNNREDLDANIPLMAHVEYWSNRTVWNRVLSTFIPVADYLPAPSPQRMLSFVPAPAVNGA